MASDTDHMRRAIALARQAEGHSSPNPAVGCVLVRGDEVVGEGWTRPPGGPHAEVVALAEAGESARGAACYTTLEPCDHTGRTGPCSIALIEAGVAEVIYALPDPTPLAAGGAERLRAAGISARRGPCRAEALDLLRPWLHALGGGPLPHVTAKIACSLDGRVATRTGESKWITGEAARARGHDLRQRSGAVIVGVGTVLADDPSLDPRPAGCEPAPGLKVVMDTRLRTPPGARLLRSPGPALIACGEGAEAGRRAALERAGAEVLTVPSASPLPRERSKPVIWGEGSGGRQRASERTNGPRPSPDIEDVDLSRGRGGGGIDLAALLRTLRTRGVQAVMIEGGPALLGSAFDAGLVDEVWTFLAPLIIGGGRPAVDGRGPDALADAFRLTGVRTEQLDPDLLVRGLTEARAQVEEPCSLAS